VGETDELAHTGSVEKAADRCLDSERYGLHTQAESVCVDPATGDGMAKAASDGDAILWRLRGHSCPSCEDGTLVLKPYKGNRAVVCDGCDTPRAQVWDRV